VEDPAVEPVVPIDYPGFNMRMARAAKRRGRRVLYYIAPKVWAWRPGRAHALAQYTDRVAVLLPFEVDFLARSGVRACYVGHPLLDRPDCRMEGHEFRRRWGLDPDRPILALLPGSREQEIRRHLDCFARTAELVQARRPDVLPVLSRAPSLRAELFAGQSFPVVEDARRLLRVSCAALVKSVTATLEAAIEGTPSVVASRTCVLTYGIVRALVSIDHISLPNLVAGRRIVPEFLQGAAGPQALALALLPLLDLDGSERLDQLAGFQEVRDRLGGPGAADRVASLAVELLETGP
jgi:lipid-A-disaccharide synthase